MQPFIVDVVLYYLDFFEMGEEHRKCDHEDTGSELEEPVAAWHWKGPLVELLKSFSKNQYTTASRKHTKVLTRKNPNKTTCSKQMNRRNNKNQKVGLKSTFLQGKGSRHLQLGATVLETGLNGVLGFRCFFLNINNNAVLYIALNILACGADSLNYRLITLLSKEVE